MLKVWSKLSEWSRQARLQLAANAAHITAFIQRVNFKNQRQNLLQILFILALGVSLVVKIMEVLLLSDEYRLPLDPNITIVISILGLALSYYASVQLAAMAYCALHWGVAVAVLIELQLLNTFSSGMLLVSIVASLVLLRPPIGTITASLLAIGFLSIWYLGPDITHNTVLIEDIDALAHQLKQSFLLSLTMIYSLLTITILMAQINLDFSFALEQRARDITLVRAAAMKELTAATEMYRFIPRHLLLLDSNATVILASTHFLAYTQLSEQDLLGRTLSDLLDFKPCNRLIDLPPNTPAYLKLKPELGLISFCVTHSELEGVALQQLIEIKFDASEPYSSSMPVRSVQLHPSAGRESLNQLLAQSLELADSLDLTVIRLPLYDDLVSEYGQQRIEYAWQECLLQLHQIFKMPTFRINAQTATIVLSSATDAALSTQKIGEDISEMVLSVDDMAWNLPFEVARHQAPLDGSTVASIENYRNIEAAEAYHLQKQKRQRLLDQMNQEGFLFHFQPVVNLTNGEILFYEGLARWPGLDPMPPPEFIALSQTMGLGFALTKNLFASFCSDVRSMLKSLGPSQFSFNISLADVLHPDFEAMLLTQCEHFSIDRRYIILELTESESLDDREIVAEKLSQLKNSGFQIAIDDFGKAFSSLERIIALPLDYLKLDSLVMRDSDRPEIQVLLKHIVQMCQGINVTLIAEGIESRAQRSLLKELGCLWGQGYLLAMPSMPIAWTRRDHTNP